MPSAYLDKGKRYFGRLLVAKGSKSDPDAMVAELKAKGWGVPAGTLPSGGPASSSYGVNPRWGYAQWPCPAGVSGQCQYGYCLVPWPNRGDKCSGEPGWVAKLESPMYAPIPGTITMHVRAATDQQSSEPRVFPIPPPADDPFWQSRHVGEDRSYSQRTAWFSGYWSRESGNVDLTYLTPTLGFEFYDLWDENGNQLVHPLAAPAGPEDRFGPVFQIPQYESPELYAEGQAQLQPGYSLSGEAGAQQGSSETTSKWPWLLGAAAIGGIVLYYVTKKP